jgi:sorbitol/mannitol transport system substrate-binding protein
MLMYRKDLADKVGITVKDKPTWGEIKELAAKIHDPANWRLRHLPARQAGLGRQHGLPVHAGQHLRRSVVRHELETAVDSKPWNDAITFYVDLLKKYGPPGSSANSFNEILALYNEGKCGMWIDATIAASFISDPKQSKVADKVAFAQAPTMVTPKGANWLWAWALAIPAGSKKVDAANKFITWATSKDYINLVGKETGWGSVPTGTRKSTYENAEFLKAARSSQLLKRPRSTAPTRTTDAAEVAVCWRAVRRHPRVPVDRYRGGSADERGTGRQDHG